MLQHILFTVLRTTGAYILLLALIRTIGRKSLSEMTLFNFALGITLGSLTAHVCLMGDESPETTITALLTFSVLGILTDLIHLKSIRMRKIINAEPMILIHNGKIIKGNMKKARITLTELTRMLRIKSAFSISDVNYAIMENNGELSVLLKASKSPLTPTEMNLSPTEKSLTKDLIMDGKILKENLGYSGLSEKELLEKLKAMGIEDTGEIFYAGLESSDELYVSLASESFLKADEFSIE
jgi:uncharacterized membrane protein YcaP (DUF421 family)